MFHPNIYMFSDCSCRNHNFIKLKYQFEERV